MSDGTVTGTIRRTVILSGLALLGATSAHAATGLELLQGAWAEASLDCASLFKDSNGRPAFQDLNGFNSGAFLIEDKKIKGQSTSCEIQRVREEGSDLSLILTCADSVMASTQDVHFKILGDGRLSRSFTGFPEYQQVYKRC
jgi:hypothetical protein